MQNLTFKDVRDLSRLPFFSVDGKGKLILKEGIIDKIIDAHTHLAMTYLFARKVPLWKKGKPVAYCFPEEGNPMDFSHFSAYDFLPKNKRKCRREFIRPAYYARGAVSTFTIPNILDEMNRMRIEKSIVHIMDFPVISNNTSHTIRSINMHKESNTRLIPFMGIHPFMRDKQKLIKKYMKQGAKGIKLHPQLQLFRPSHEKAFEIYALAETYHLPILFHTGLSPVSPRWQGRYLHMKDFETAVRFFPKVTFIFGHAGGVGYEEAVRLGKKYENIYFETSGQSVPAIKLLIKTFGAKRVIYGSDWPFYPMAMSLAKALLATEDNKKARKEIFSKTIHCLVF